MIDFNREHHGHREPGGLRWGVEPICRMLTEHGVQITPSTYYEWKDKLPSPREQHDQVLIVEIQQVWDENFQAYRGQEDLADVEPGKHTGGPVHRGTVDAPDRYPGCAPGSGEAHHYRRGCPLPGDLAQRQYAPDVPNILWAANFTYVSTRSGWAYVAFVTDPYARRILGWRVTTSMTTTLVLDTVEQAIWQRERDSHADELVSVITHSDHRCQYTSVHYGERLAQSGPTPSAGTVADSYNNTQAETINRLYKTELVKRHGPWHNADHLELATAE